MRTKEYPNFDEDKCKSSLNVNTSKGINDQNHSQVSVLLGCDCECEAERDIDTSVEEDGVGFYGILALHLMPT